MSKLINRAAVRKLAIDTAAKAGRSGQITHVGDSVYVACEAAVRKLVVRLVESHPGAFKTLKAG